MKERVIARFSKKSRSRRASDAVSESDAVSAKAHDFQSEMASQWENPQSSPGRVTVDNPNVFYTVEDRQNETVVREYDAIIGGFFGMAGLDDEFRRNFYDREVIVRKTTDDQRKVRMHSSREAFVEYHRKLRAQ